VNLVGVVLGVLVEVGCWLAVLVVVAAVGVVCGDWGVGVVVRCSITTTSVANTPKTITTIAIAAILPIPKELCLNILLFMWCSA